LLQKHPHQPATVTHFKPSAAIEAIASFGEGVAAVALQHPEIAPIAVLHMFKALFGIRTQLTDAEAKLFYSVFCRSRTDEATVDDCREDFEESGLKFRTTSKVSFETALQRLIDTGILEQLADKLYVRQRILLKTPTPIFE
jgi:hypothetical protein